MRCQRKEFVSLFENNFVVPQSFQVCERNCLGEMDQEFTVYLTNKVHSLGKDMK